MQPEHSVSLNDFQDASTAFALPEPMNYSPEDFIYVPGWSSDNIYGPTDNYGRPHSHGHGFPSANGIPAAYGDPNPNGESIAYGQIGTESSDQINLWNPTFQAGQNISDMDFDMASFQMPPRSLTHTPAPISSADVFDNSQP